MRRLASLFVLAAIALLLTIVGCEALVGDSSTLAKYLIVDGTSVDGGTDATILDSSPPPADGGGDAPEASCAPDDLADCDGGCGVKKNRCGTVIACGGCPAGQTCGGPAPGSTVNIANVCGVGACTPECANRACGLTDGCESICAFGGCPVGLACMGGVCKCGPSTCSGCCGTDGQCHSGVGDPAGCGTGGVVCQPTVNGKCTKTACGGNGQPCCGGSACTSPLACEDGGFCGCTPKCDSTTKCGADDGCGGVCQAGWNMCPEGERCVTGGVCTCDPAACPGCCNGSSCVVMTSSTQCGSNGVACVDCGGKVCNVGCGSSCGGEGLVCCTPGDTCIAPLTCVVADGGSMCSCAPSCAGKACGEGDGCGNVCPGSCLAGQFCDVEAGTCGCDGTSCPEGCCIAGVCINGNVGNPALCGIGGVACTACAAGQICSGGCVSGDGGAEAGM